jgi:tetratricopeptide (TPR) repeat protein
LLATAFLTSASAQNTDVQGTQLYKHYQMKYVFGMKYNDREVAKNALYSMIAMDPNDDSLKMVLCYYYYEQNQFASSLFVSADLLSRRFPDNVDALADQCHVLSRIWVCATKPLSAYESLYLQDQRYRCTVPGSPCLQFELANDMPNVRRIVVSLSSKIRKPMTMKLTFLTKMKTNSRRVTLEAACYNMKGMLAKQQGNMEEAKKQLEKALELDPEFVLANQNLSEL